jgi:predicted ATP-binding protein involved in virulence
MPRSIERVEIDKLFGRFNYSIDLSEHENTISILTAPNGYGKSTILKIISNFASGAHHYFIREKFESIRFYVTDEPVIEIVRADDDIQKNQITIRSGNRHAKIRDPFLRSDGDEGSFFLERAFPFLTRVGPRVWRHDRTGERLEKNEILARYGDHPIFRKGKKSDEWLEKIHKSLSVFSIPTNRLKSAEGLDTDGDSSTSNGLMVGSIAQEIKDNIQSAIRNQFEIGRKKETSFPARLIESLKEKITPTRDSIIESIQAVQEYEERYARLGLVPHTGTTKQLNVHAESTETAGMLVLKTYLDDIREKFSLLDSLARKLDVFSGSINNLIAFKSIETSPDEGIVVKVTEDNAALPLSVLSSGEQHLIVLIGKLVFNTGQGSLVLIDEPEISFHPEWQEKFLEILENIRSLTGFSVLIATHSPLLIGDRWERVIELAEQNQSIS